MPHPPRTLVGILAAVLATATSANEPTGVRTALVDDLTRGYVRAAPGRLEATTWDPEEQVLVASGTEAATGVTLVAFVPGEASTLDVATEGLGAAELVPNPDGGSYLVAETDAAAWSIRVGPAA